MKRIDTRKACSSITCLTPAWTSITESISTIDKESIKAYLTFGASSCTISKCAIFAVCICSCGIIAWPAKTSSRINIKSRETYLALGARRCAISKGAILTIYIRSCWVITCSTRVNLGTNIRSFRAYFTEERMSIRKFTIFAICMTCYTYFIVWFNNKLIKTFFTLSTRYSPIKKCAILTIFWTHCTLFSGQINVIMIITFHTASFRWTNLAIRLTLAQLSSISYKPNQTGITYLKWSITNIAIINHAWKAPFIRLVLSSIAVCA